MEPREAREEGCAHPLRPPIERANGATSVARCATWTSVAQKGTADSAALSIRPATRPLARQSRTAERRRERKASVRMEQSSHRARAEHTSTNQHTYSHHRRLPVRCFARRQTEARRATPIPKVARRLHVMAFVFVEELSCRLNENSDSHVTIQLTQHGWERLADCANQSRTKKRPSPMLLCTLCLTITRTCPTTSGYNEHPTQVWLACRGV